jgi:hypothetical protein
MNLPNSGELDISKLAGIFNNTSSTYKYYWFISIIEACEHNLRVISKKELFARMLCNAWYTVNYFHVSFGSQDLIQQAVQVITQVEKIPVNIRKEDLLLILLNTENTTTVNLLKHFDKNVPHWFLSSWITRERGESDSLYKSKIYGQSLNESNQTLYALLPDRIEINTMWNSYLKENARILKDFCYWNLSMFLQVRNPNVPNIPGKLIKPPMRRSLSKQRKEYWDIAINELDGVDCIYTNNKLTADNYALDHFVPHAFVSHDLIWNLVPVDISFNSIKSDKLPNMDNHFNNFFNIQKSAFEIITAVNPKSRLIDEYIYLFSTVDKKLSFEYDKFREIISPLISIASNNGFTYLHNNV